MYVKHEQLMLSINITFLFMLICPLHFEVVYLQHAVYSYDNYAGKAIINNITGNHRWKFLCKPHFIYWLQLCYLFHFQFLRFIFDHVYLVTKISCLMSRVIPLTSSGESKCCKVSR